MSLETIVVGEAPASHATPLLMLAVPQGGLPPSLAEVDANSGNALSRLYAAGDFRGTRDEVAVLYPEGPAARLLLVGMGGDDRARAGSGAVRRAAAVAARRARGLGVERAAFHLAPEAASGLDAGAIARAAAEGLPYGAWQYTELKKPAEDQRAQLERVAILVGGGAAEEGHRTGLAIAAGQALARSIQVLPGNECTPTYIGEQAAALAARHGMHVTVLDKSAIIAEKLTALLAVAQGSAQEPRFIALEYAGAEGAPVVLVGKGVTFDSGGISIKPAQSMEDMKFDMSGAAAVLGTFEMLGRLRPRVRVVGLIPSAENMVSGSAYKPGDVVRSHLGKTIEVVNTDAEGRLLLADALSYARRYQPACVVDAATLTGAVVIALGHVATGIMGTDDALVDELRAAAERADERVWPLPLWDEFRDLIKSDIADVKNSGGRPAGTITAAWFLREFVDGFPWAHLDIAGTAYSDRDHPTRVKGPTGVGVRLFSEFVLGRAK
ncbi:MAG TPA: leucyl aminopeptidase [Gemmatimonadales bacterium]|nr:leucyl aminopeptidase [Gemmatimonadales bacterium]